MGFLNEDSMFFNYERAVSSYCQLLREIQLSNNNFETGSEVMLNLELAKKEHTQMKKKISLYIGLATGFCGSFTSFSSFARDIFLALADELQPRKYSYDTIPTSAFSPPALPRNPGYSIMAIMAVVIVTLSLCVSAWLLGTLFSQTLVLYMPSLEFKSSHRLIDGFVAILAWTSWIILTILAFYLYFRSPGSQIHTHRPNIFSLALAPLGCVARFYLSSSLNSKIKTFPLGTFTVNIVGTIIFGAAYSSQRIPLKSITGCQVLQGVQDGLCGCLTTVSSWIAELFLLNRKCAFIYGTVSIVASLCSLIIIMGSILWTKGSADPLCGF